MTENINEPVSTDKKDNNFYSSITCGWKKNKNFSSFKSNSWALFGMKLIFSSKFGIDIIFL